MTAKKLTRTGARSLTVSLDRVASAIQTEHALLGIDPKIATDFARRCDLISDAVERRAVANFPKAAFDASVIGDVVPGPLVEGTGSDPVDPYMDDHFTQERFEELDAAQEGGQLGAPTSYITPTMKAASETVSEGFRILQAAGFSPKSKHEQVAITVGQELVGQVRTITDLTIKIDENKAKLKAIAGDLLTETEGLEASQAKAIKSLVEGARSQLTTQGNLLLKAKEGILEATALIQAAEKKRTLDAIQADLLIAVAQKFGAEVSQFISATTDALRDQEKTLTLTYKGSELLAKTGGLADLAARFKTFLSGSLDKLMSVFQSVTGIMNKNYKRVESAQDALLAVLKTGKAASVKIADDHGFDLTK